MKILHFNLSQVNGLLVSLFKRLTCKVSFVKSNTQKNVSQNIKNCISDKHLDVAKALFQAQESYYKFITVELRNEQLKIQNSYFWASSAIFTVLTGSFLGLFTGEEFIHLDIFSMLDNCPIDDLNRYILLHKIVVIISFLCCIISIVTGIDSMRMRGDGIKLQFRNIPHAEMLQAILNMGDDYSSTKGLQWLMRENIECIDNNEQEIRRVGKHLRRTSYLLVTAFISGIIAFLM